MPKRRPPQFVRMMARQTVGDQPVRAVSDQPVQVVSNQPVQMSSNLDDHNFPPLRSNVTASRTFSESRPGPKNPEGSLAFFRMASGMRKYTPRKKTEKLENDFQVSDVNGQLTGQRDQRSSTNETQDSLLFARDVVDEDVEDVVDDDAPDELGEFVSLTEDDSSGSDESSTSQDRRSFNSDDIDFVRKLDNLLRAQDEDPEGSDLESEVASHLETSEFNRSESNQSESNRSESENEGEHSVSESDTGSVDSSRSFATSARFADLSSNENCDSEPGARFKDHHEDEEETWTNSESETDSYDSDESDSETEADLPYPVYRNEQRRFEDGSSTSEDLTVSSNNVPKNVGNNDSFFSGVVITFVSKKSGNQYLGTIKQSGSDWVIVTNVAVLNQVNNINDDEEKLATSRIIVKRGDVESFHVIEVLPKKVVCDKGQKSEPRHDEEFEWKTQTRKNKNKWRPAKPEKHWKMPVPKLVSYNGQSNGQQRNPKVPVPEYEIPEEILNVLKYKLKPWRGMTPKDEKALKTVNQLVDGGLTESNYKSFFCFLLYAEEARLQEDILNYDMSVDICPCQDGYSIVVPGILDKSPNVIPNDVIFVSKNLAESKEYMLKVKITDSDTIYLRSPENTGKFAEEIFGGAIGQVRCWVRFTVNRSTLKSMHRSLLMLTESIIGRLFPKIDRPYTTLPKPHIPRWKLFNKSIGDNAEQLQAVSQIVAGSSGVYPYIIFGPPGTGKTVTLVEAIKQVFQSIARSNIIVATPSNSAADLIAQRLLVDIPKENIVRLYAKCREETEIIPSLREISKFGYLKKLGEIRIICLTLGMCSKLIGLKKDSGFFTHFFIDEAGQATETEFIIPLAGNLGPNSHIILSGDPHQLGPVVVSSAAKKFGLETSPMERLMANFSLYDKSPNGCRNPLVITKLCMNFRAHPELLEIPSRLFYDNELLACANPEKVGQLAYLDFLPRHGFPMVFHSVRSVHEREDLCPSLFNMEEAKQVREYVRKLFQSRVKASNIGIISPYRRQCRLIKHLIREDFKHLVEDILIGSTEEFQGQERLVMILSTTRSTLNKHGFATLDMGFLTFKKRFNVAITRAQALQIIVGDPFLLRNDRHWDQLVQKCFHNQAMVGCYFDNEMANAYNKGLSYKPKKTQLK